MDCRYDRPWLSVTITRMDLQRIEITIFPWKKRALTKVHDDDGKIS